MSLELRPGWRDPGQTMGDQAAETSALANLLAVRERMKGKKIGALKSAKLNTTIAAKIKTKIINNSSVLKISLKHNNKALALALSAEKEKSRRLENERMLLQKEVKMVHFHNAELRQNMNIVNKTLREIQLSMNLELNTAIEVSANIEYSPGFLPVPTSQRNSECLSRSSQISLPDDGTFRYTAVAMRVPVTQVDNAKFQDISSEQTKDNYYIPGFNKPSNVMTNSSDSSNADAASDASSTCPRVSLSHIEQLLEDTRSCLQNVQSETQCAEVKRSYGGSNEHHGYVTQRRKRSTMSRSSNQSLPSGQEQEEGTITLSNVQPEETVYDAEMDLTASEAGAIVTVATKSKPDHKIVTDETEKRDGASLRKVRNLSTEKKQKSNRKSVPDPIEKKTKASKTKLKGVFHSEQLETQFENTTPVDFLTLQTCHEFESSLKPQNGGQPKDCRRTLVPVTHSVKQEQSEYVVAETTKETEKHAAFKIPQMVDHVLPNEDSLCREGRLVSCFEDFSNPTLQENLVSTNETGKQKVHKNTCKRSTPSESYTNILAFAKTQELSSISTSQDQPSITVEKKTNQRASSNTCETEATLESCTANILTFEENQQIPSMPAKPSRLIERKEKQMVNKKSQEIATMSASPEKPSNIIEKAKQKVKMSFEESQEISVLPALQEKPSRLNERKGKQKVNKRVCERESLSVNMLPLTEIQDIASIPALQDNPSNVTEKENQTMIKKICESESYAVSKSPVKSLEISDMPTLPSSVIENGAGEVSKKAYERTGAQSESHFEKNLLSEEIQVVSYLPILQSKCSKVIEEQRKEKLIKKTRERKAPLESLPVTKVHLEGGPAGSNVPVCQDKSSSVHENEKQNVYQNTCGIAFESGDEENVRYFQSLNKPKGKASKPVNKTKRNQSKGKIQAASCDNQDKYSQNDESKACDLQQIDKRSSRSSLASSKSSFAKLRRETYVVAPEPDISSASSGCLLKDEIVKCQGGTFAGVREPEDTASMNLILKPKTAKPSRGTFVVRAPGVYLTSTACVLQEEIVKDRQGTYNGAFHPDETLNFVQSSVIDENMRNRRGTYVVAPLDNTLRPVSTGSVSNHKSIANVHAADVTLSTVFNDQITKPRRGTYVIQALNPTVSNFPSNPIWMSSETLQSNSSKTRPQENYPTVEEIQSDRQSLLDEHLGFIPSEKGSVGTERHSKLLKKGTCSRKRNIENTCKAPSPEDSNALLLGNCTEPSKEVITDTICSIPTDSKREPIFHQLNELLDDALNVKTERESYMIDMINESVLVDSMVDCSSSLEFSNITTHENMPFTPRRSLVDGPPFLGLTSAEDHTHYESSHLSKTLQIPEETNREQTFIEMKRPKIEDASFMDPNYGIDTPGKTNKVLQDLTNVRCPSDPSPKVKLEESTLPGRRRRAPVNYAEPKLGSKLRRGDKHTNTEFLSSPIYKVKEKLSKKGPKKRKVKSSKSMQ